jgi:hypothetical protein
MAVVQLRAGIYVNSIEEVPAAEQTAAYKYASLFTKARKENWEMSQRQAASEIADAKVRDAAAIKSYDSQIADYGDRLKQLDKDIASAGTDVAKANAATQRTALQEATARQNNAILWEKAKVEGVVVSGGSRSSSSSSGTSTSSGGGGTGGGGSSTQKSADDLVNVEIGAQGDGGRDPSALQEGLKQGALKSANISNTDPAVVAAAKAGGVAASVGLLSTDYRNGGYSESDAYDAAWADVKQDLEAGGHLDSIDAYENKRAVDLAGGGGRTSTSERSSQSSSVRDPATLQSRYPGLGTMPVADTVTADTAPKVPLDTAALEAKRKELAGQLADLLARGAPASEVDDFITRSREIMAGRFGRVAESPNFYQRNVAQAILSGRMTNEDIALLRSDYDNRGKPVRMLPTPTAEGGPVGTPGFLTPTTSYGDTGGFGEAETLGSLKTSQTGARTSPVMPGATPTAAPIVTGGSAPAVSPGASGEAPATAASSAADTAAASGASPAAVGAAAGAAAAAVPTSADTVRAVENTRLNNFPNRMTELDALFPDGVPQEVLDAAAGIRKSTPSGVDGPRMGATAGTVETSSMPTRTPSGGAPNIGSKPEALGDFSIPDVPSAYNDRPFDAVTNPYGGKFAPNKQSPPVPGEGGARFETTYRPDGVVPMSDLEREQLIKLKQKAREDAEDAKKKGKSGSTLEYFKGRFDSAKQIIDQPGKLARLTASGPGKVAADVYNANKTTGKDFKLTYDTLTATYEDDKEALATAHQVALALDIASRARTAPPKA